MKFDAPLKQIVYRGGLIKFSIPSSWAEEYEEAGGGTFFDATDSATLRLNVLSFAYDHPVSLRQPYEVFLRRMAEYNGVVEELPDHRFLLKYAISAMEGDEMLSIFRWEVARMVSPRDYNVAAFSFTVETARSQSAEILQLLPQIESEIKQVCFGTK